MSAPVVHDPLAALDATAQAALVRSGELGPDALVRAAIDRIERLNPTLNAVVSTRYEQALTTAATASGPFAGVPYLLKDLVAEMAGSPLTEGSRYLRGHVSAVDSALVTRLRAAGLAIVGRSNAPEFGMTPTVEPELYGPCRNPWDITRSTSGSSGGAAAAVAAGLVPMAHGNDLGGSLRYPASACGVFGFKPTRARVSLAPLYGDVINGLAVEHAITRSVRDSAALLDATAGAEPGDPYLPPAPRRPFAAEVGADPGRLRIAYSPRTADGTPGHPDCLAALDDAVALLVSLGHEVIETDLPGLDDRVGAAIGTMYQATMAWIIAHWTRRLGRAPADGELEPLTAAFWAGGQPVSAARYLLAIEDLQRFARQVAGFLAPFDAWLTPTLSTPPLPLGEITSTPDQPMRALQNGGRTVGYPGVVANITGNPAMSVPLWWNADGLPIGVHFLGRYADEAGLFRLAAQLEAARPWSNRIPPVSA
ncbi:amidase [Nocardia seriolae]|uniref:amidase n=1 Tax=Nocardia seriolae TaxID=37332 RepID=A0ABC8AW72_9NOCA|nr:amidase [Nocardia seriolae]APA98671.1 Amidase [Nocardia seriolae]OJF80661.1 amidase [Nocardia seriolae]PSK28854.1 amidase [Nocardia seriolae]QOW35403.1 amidase [Nocardia seriolae]QUN17126.1 amidase [Nocardia seriolae]